MQRIYAHAKKKATHLKGQLTGIHAVLCKEDRE
jgi:hypothetical protein